MAQAPVAQVAVALGSTQLRPQVPQFEALTWVLTSQPLAGLLSQSPKPAAQRTTVHIPPAQPLAATLVSAHTAPHALQLAGSMAVLAQYADGPSPQVRSGAPHTVPQTLAEQTVPAAQAIPHPPQLALSLRRSTSQPLAALPSQSRKPRAQVATAQAPAAQVEVALGSAQVRPQAPQLVTLVWVSSSQPLAGLPSQSAKPAAQRTTVQTPPAQPLAATLASAHTAPHAPQLAGSMAVLAQKAVGPAPQVLSGEAQAVPHIPAEHTRPAAQAVPQPPQLALSLRVSTSQPLAALPSQSRKPVAQAAIAQAPAAQVEVALGSAQTRPHAPQLTALVWVSTSQPLAAVPSQSAKPVAQRTTVQALPAQPLVATLASAHTVPHAPQWAGSITVLAQKAVGPAPQARSGEAQVVPHTPAEHTRPAAQAAPQPPQWALSLRVSTSQPLAALPSQSKKPAAQAAIAQAPAAQVEVALESAQARPHAPQFAALVWVLTSQPLAAAPSQSP
jgi:hypothetical protein